MILVACTETPSFFPPCVNPNTPCTEPEAGADASEGGGVSDGPVNAISEDAGDAR
jgi:hypothetical protein